MVSGKKRKKGIWMMWLERLHSIIKELSILLEWIVEIYFFPCFILSINNKTYFHVLVDSKNRRLFNHMSNPSEYSLRINRNFMTIVSENTDVDCLD